MEQPLRTDVYTVLADSVTMDLLAFKQWEKPGDLPSQRSEEDCSRAQAAARAHIEALVNQLTPMEADIILGRLDRVPEASLAAVLGVVQSGVSYAYSRAVQKLQILVKLPILTREEFEADITPLMIRYGLDRPDILWHWWDSTSYTYVSKVTGVHRRDCSQTVQSFVAGLEADESEQAQWYLQHFRLLLANPGVKDRNRENRWRQARESEAAV